MATLNQQIGVPADDHFKLSLDPVPTEAPALSARMEDLMKEAERQRPDLAAARAQVSSAIEDITVARAVGRPSIALSASRDSVITKGIYPEPNNIVQNYGQVGVTITVPIFTGFSVGYGVRQSQATLEEREVSAEQVRLQVTVDVWKGYYGLDEAVRGLAASAKLLKTSQTNLEVALGEFKAGSPGTHQCGTRLASGACTIGAGSWAALRRGAARCFRYGATIDVFSQHPGPCEARCRAKGRGEQRLYRRAHTLLDSPAS
jgi:outer membrane protein TolC